MNKIILLDASPLGRISNPSATPANLECYKWLENLITSDYRVIVPEIADYEIRRELIRAGKTRGIARLDLLKNTLDYLPLKTDVMLKAAELWAKARNQGKPTADPKALDCDVILAAQALMENGMVATENVGHLSLFVEAEDWHDILPV